MAMCGGYLFIFHCSLLALTVVQGIGAVEFEVKNEAPTSPGGLRFAEEIGVEYAERTMAATTNFIWDMFEENNVADRKNIERVYILVDNYKGAEAITYGEKIIVSAAYLEGYQGNLTWEFTSLIYHEMTHVWQWNGAGRAPSGLVEGIADYTILKAGYNPPGFAKPGMGESWAQGYDFTARFLEYCEGLKPGFVAALNKKMRDDFSVKYFDELLGKTVEQLWSKYKDSYGGTGTETGMGTGHNNVNERSRYRVRRWR